MRGVGKPRWFRRRSLKRRLLRELVEDNLDQIRGGPPRRKPGRIPGGWRLLAVALLPLSLFTPAHSGPPGVTAGSAVAGAGTIATGTNATGADVDHGLHPGVLEGGEGAVSAAEDSGLRAAADLDPVDPAVFPLGVERVVIDPGHGGRNGGTRTSSGLVEKDLTLDVALRLAELLEAEGLEVLLTRRDDVEITLEERAAFANRAEADLFLSIHVNWIENRQVRGVETYFLGSTDDPFVSRLAAAENLDAGYSQADLRDLLDDLYAGLRQDSSEKAAGAIQRSLLRSLRTVNPAVEDRGVKTAPFIVLMKTDMPAVLAEVSCLSNQKEAELLARPLYRQYIAEALRDGIRAYAAAGRTPDGDGPVTAERPAEDSKGTRS